MKFECGLRAINRAAEIEKNHRKMYEKCSNICIQINRILKMKKYRLSCSYKSTNELVEQFYHQNVKNLWSKYSSKLAEQVDNLAKCETE